MGLFNWGADEQSRNSASYFGVGSPADEPSLLERAQNAAQNAIPGMRPKTAREQLIDDVCPSLTFQQRLVGFGIFFTIGAVVTLTSMFSFSQLLTGNPVPFALKYSIGNVISLFSTAFIVGPARQLKGMTAPTRWLAALVYLGAIAGTLVSALVLDSGILVLVFIIVQFCAEVWYVLSYIPYGRRLCATCLQSAVGDV